MYCLSLYYNLPGVESNIMILLYEEIEREININSHSEQVLS